MPNLDISGNVTPYRQEKRNYCAAASAKMCRNGYPNSNERRSYTQDELWNTLQFYNSALPEDIGGWWTNPDGLAGGLSNLANPADVNWRILKDRDRDVVLLTMLNAMKATHFPTPVVVDKGSHWVVVVGWETDGDPDSPTLLQIEYYDPKLLYQTGGYTKLPADQWFAGRWSSPVTIPGTWQDQYVAIIAEAPFF